MFWVANRTNASLAQTIALTNERWKKRKMYPVHIHKHMRGEIETSVRNPTFRQKSHDYVQTMKLWLKPPKKWPAPDGQQSVLFCESTPKANLNYSEIYPALAWIITTFPRINLILIQIKTTHNDPIIRHDKPPNGPHPFSVLTDVQSHANGTFASPRFLFAIEF